MRLARLSIVGCVFAVLAHVFAFETSAYAQLPAGPPARPMITDLVDEANLAPLSGNTRPEANAANDRGRVADSLPMAHLTLQLRRPPEQEQALTQFIDQLHDPASANFHKWLTPDQFGARFGPAASDIQQITGWLQSHGFRVNVIYPSGMSIDFSGTAGQVRTAFHTEIHYIQARGANHIANMSDPQIPAALASTVVGIVALHDIAPRTKVTPRRKNGVDYTAGSGNYPVTPADLATIYNLNPVFNVGVSGQNQTIYLIEDTNLYTNNDWTTFRSTFGLSGYSGATLSTVHPAPPSGSNNCSDPGVNSDDIEAILDAEYASAAAPSAAIVMATCANSPDGLLIALQNLINGSNPPAIISMSYGECEAFNGASSNAAYNAIYQQGVAEGTSIFVSAGDEAAGSCDYGGKSVTHGIGVNALASTPYNVAVGGTDFSDTYAGSTSTYWSSSNTATYGSAKSYIPEIPWNDSCASQLIASAHGHSTTYGSSSYCNSLNRNSFYLNNVGGSGGPSGCATGSPSISGVVSGSCQGYAKPSWQSGVIGIPNDGVRDLPDVSLFAADGMWNHYYVFCYSDHNNGGVPCTGAPSGWSGAGGTSFASPIMAGIQALINQNMGAAQGNPNVVYYKLAAVAYGASGNASCNSSNGNTISSSCIFNDVTQGDMDAPCTGSYNCYQPSGTYGVLSTNNSAYAPAYGTTTSWDFATGLGSINVYNLVTGWKSFVVANPMTLQVSPSNDIASSGNQGGPFSPSSFQYMLQASIGSVGYSISGVPSWLTPSSTSGTTTTTGTTITFTVNSNANSLSPATYNATITFTDTTYNKTVLTRTAALIVLSASSSNGILQVSPATNIAASGDPGGPFSPSSFQYQLSASKGSVGYSISGLPSWLSASSTSGTVTTSPSTVTFTVNSNTNGLSFGFYNATIAFNDTTNNAIIQTISAAVFVMASGSGGGGSSTAKIFVSAKSGSDTGVCPITAPCATLNYALSIADAGAQIIILDGGAFGPIILSGPITILGNTPNLQTQIVADPTAQAGCIGALPSGCYLTNNGFGVEIAAAATDSVKIEDVFMSAGSSGTGALKLTSGGQIQLSNNVFRGNSSSNAPIVTLAPNNPGTTQAQVYFSNSDVGFNNTQANAGAVLVQPIGTTSIKLHFNHVEVHNASYGIRTDGSLQSSPAVQVATIVSESEFFSFNNAAINAFSTSGTGTVNAAYNNVIILNAQAAIKTDGPQSTVSLSNSTIAGNGAGVQILNSATIVTSGNNTIVGNGTNVSGGTLTPLAAR